MYVTSFNKEANGMYVKLTDYIEAQDVNEVILNIKNVARRNLISGFTSIVDLSDVPVTRVIEHSKEIRQALIVLSSKHIGRIIRIGKEDVLTEFARLYDHYYEVKANAPLILTYSSVEECKKCNPELDAWFTTMLENVVVLE